MKIIKKFDIKEECKEILSKQFKEGESIAIKLHMGEKGNKHFLKPSFVKQIVNALLELNIKPFLFDSPVKYPGGRDTCEKYIKTAEEHGYSKETMNCPIVISNKYIIQKTEDLDIQVCKALVEADGVLVLSHVKGHGCAGFGGAIKNLGMGALTKESKAEIHDGGMPVVDKAKCTGCGVCVNICPADGIKIINGKFTYEQCFGCSKCILICPNNALKTKVDIFDKLLAQGAYAAWKNFKKSYYINVLKDISKKCDCVASGGGPIIAKDIGVLFSEDIIAIDEKSVDLINEQTGENLFKNKNFKEPKLQIKYMKELIKNNK